MIDSGIDYQNEVFRNAGGSRIAYLWDQSLEAEESDMGAAKVPYGRLFRKRDIDLALDSEKPFSIVPSRDTNGHGTALAGIAAGNMVPGENFYRSSAGGNLSSSN